MSYQHGIYIEENATSITAPLTVDSAVQVVVGTAPVNLIANPIEVVNKPILVNSFAEAQKKIGYSNSFDKFTICQSVDASFRVFNVAPLVLINVLNPETHNIAVTREVKDIADSKVLIEEEGILLDDDFIVKNEDGDTTYTKNTDYTAEFDNNGYVLVKIVADGKIVTDEATKITFAYKQLDPSAVTENDIVGGYYEATGKYTGLENISQIYPRLGIIPGLILCPGWSHNPTIGAAMTAKCEGINGTFKANCIKDIDTSKDNGAVVYTDTVAWKNNNSYTDKHDIVCWPKVQVGNKKYYMSALTAALIAYTDGQNDGVPYVSPSNKSLKITGTSLEDGTEVFLDQVQANTLNSNGIVTAININGWKLWGNNTGIYPSSTDVKDRFIPVRRMFDWWGNTFILSYFQKVDNPLNTRLIESFVDSENIRANGYKARNQIADARIEYNTEENPTTDLLDGKIRFKQYLTSYTPAKTIINTLEFDPKSLTTVLGGE